MNEDVADKLEGRMIGAVKQAYGDELTEEQCEHLGRVAARAAAHETDAYSRDLQKKLRE